MSGIPDLGTLMHVAAFGLIVIGITGIVLSSHLIRIIFGLALLEAGANLLLMLSTFHEGARAPILLNGQAPTFMADPVPQALVLTAIVIGVGVLALALSVAIRVQSAYGTLDIHEIRDRLEADITASAGIELPYSSDQPEDVKREETAT